MRCEEERDEKRMKSRKNDPKMRRYEALWRTLTIGTDMPTVPIAVPIPWRAIRPWVASRELVTGQAMLERVIEPMLQTREARCGAPTEALVATPSFLSRRQLKFRALYLRTEVRMAEESTPA